MNLGIIVVVPTKSTHNSSSISAFFGDCTNYKTLSPAFQRDILRYLATGSSTHADCILISIGSYALATKALNQSKPDIATALQYTEVAANTVLGCSDLLLTYSEILPTFLRNSTKLLQRLNQLKERDAVDNCHKIIQKACTLAAGRTFPVMEKIERLDQVAFRRASNA